MSSSSLPMPSDDEERAADIRAITLVELVGRPDASVRLRNSVLLASQDGSLPFTTVGEYVDAGPVAVGMMMQRVRSFGRKTARELDLFVSELAAGRLSERIITVEEPPTETELLGELGPLDVATALAEEVPSTRLANVVTSVGLGSTTVAAILAEESTFFAGLLRQPNVGRTTIAEFRRLLVRAARRQLRSKGIDPDKVEWLLRASARVANVDAGPDEIPPAPSSLREGVDWLLGKLVDRDADVIRRRYGRDGFEEETLEEVGRLYVVTRERIRQIEARALRSMRAWAKQIAHFEEHLEKAWSDEWLRITDGRGILLEADLSGAVRRLSPDVAIAMAIQNEWPSGWLSRVATRVDHGWVGSPLDPLAVSAAAEKLRETALARLPRPIDAGCDPETAYAAAGAILGRSIHRGYLVPRRTGTRLRRAVELHAVLAASPDDLPISDLVGRHLASDPTDGCSVRDALIVMEAASHLFLEVADDRWWAVGSRVAAIDPPACSEDPLAPADPGQGTIARALIDVLSARGPERLHTLYKEAESILPEGRSANSVGPVLLSRPDLFARALPGVYGLVGELPDRNAIHFDPPPYLLDDNQLRLLALAKRCGESADAYPLWSPSAEYALARWGRKSGRTDAYRSLLAVSDVSSWPLSPEARAAWSATVEAERRFELGMPARAEDYVLPGPDRLLATLVLLREEGRIGWMGINRISARRLDTCGAVGMLALVTAVGLAVAPGDDPEDWQRPHEAGARVDESIRDLSDELGRRGFLDWRRGAAREVLEAASSSGASAWVDAEALRRMIDDASQTVPESERIMGEILEALLDPDADDDEAQTEQPARMTIERGEELMNWLLDS